MSDIYQTCYLNVYIMHPVHVSFKKGRQCFNHIGLITIALLKPESNAITPTDYITLYALLKYLQYNRITLMAL